MTASSLGWFKAHWRQLLALALLIVLPLGFLGDLAEDIHRHGNFPWEAPLMRSVRADAPAWFRQVALLLSSLGSGTWMVPICLALLALGWRKSKVIALYFVFSLAGAMLLNIIIKVGIGRTRPQIVSWLWQEGDKSFPSGHATMAAALTVTLTALLWRTAWRWPVIVLGALYSFFMGVSRVYVGVHYPSDVLAGWALGVAWAAGSALVLWPRLRVAQGHATLPGPASSAAPADTSEPTLPEHSHNAAGKK